MSDNPRDLTDIDPDPTARPPRFGEGGRPTIADVAKVANVSVTTAARALSGRGYASTEARRRVHAAAEAVGYVPNYVARSLRHGRTNTLGLVVADVENSFYSVVAKNVEAVATKAGYSVVLCSSNDDSTRERALLDLLEGLRIAGLIVTPTGGNRRRLQQLQRDGIAIIQVDRIVQDLVADAVLVDNEGGAYDAVVALIKAGHRRIGLLAGAPHVTTGSERSKGYVRALEEHELPTEPSLMRGGTFRRDHALEEARALLAQEPSPTAIFAANNILAEACMVALKEARLEVPRDVSLVAFDDVEWMRIMDRSITAVRQPVAEMAQAAAEMLLRRLRGNAASAAKLIYQPDLILRDSIGPPRPERKGTITRAKVGAP